MNFIVTILQCRSSILDYVRNEGLGYNRAMKREDFVFSVAELRAYLDKQGVKYDPALLVEEHPFRLLIPKYYIDLIDWTDANDPLLRMVLTSNLEQEVREYEVADPIADKPHSPVPGVVHRHADRCLLMLTNMCAVHCRFCFRKNMLETNRADMRGAIEYIASQKDIREVILSGGDPFTFPDAFMQSVVEQLTSIEHVRLIRFHTRTPVVYPARITDSFLKALIGAKPTTVVLHINHPREITPAFVQSINRLNSSGAMVLSQTVLMKRVNDSADALQELFVRLVEIGVKPYYLHHLDAAAGTHHFRISLARGKELYAKLRQTTTGIAIPTYVIDLPGGLGKYPVDLFKHVSGREYSVQLHDGTLHAYIDHADEAPIRGGNSTSE